MKIISRLTISASSIVKLVMDKVVSLILELMLSFSYAIFQKQSFLTFEFKSNDSRISRDIYFTKWPLHSVS